MHRFAPRKDGATQAPMRPHETIGLAIQKPETFAMSDSAIVIDLTSSNQNKPVSTGTELIQKGAFDSLRRQLGEDLNSTSSLTKRGVPGDSDQHDYPFGSGLTYFIDGTRGAGKTTFLRFAYQEFSNSTTARYSPNAGQAVHSLARLLPLMYLDPSRIESSEIVLLHVLKHLRRLAQECPTRGSAHEERLEKFRRLFQQMAGGMHLFVSKDSALKEVDAELFLDYGLDRAADSQRLRALLHDTIDLVCEMYNANALLLAIDDADTKADLALEVLESIRKYLDTPRMVVLVTGDLEMYSLLVQNHFQRDFASEDKGLNPDRKTQQTRMVEHLEDQYLLKLFPIQRRIQLKTLHTLVDKLRYAVTIPETAETLTLTDAVDRIAVEGLRLRVQADKRLFREHVLKLPVRSVLQLLSTYFKPDQESNANGRERASEALRATALSSLYRHDVDVESIAEGDLHAAIEAAFDLSLLDGDPDTAAYLRPQVRNLSLRNSYVSLSADIARLCEKNPARAITYLLSTAGSSSIYRLVEKIQGDVPSRSSGDGRGEELQRRVKQYLSVGRTENSLNWSWHATAALIGATTSSTWVLRQGITGVRTGSKGGARTIDDQLRAALSLDGVVLYPAIAFSQSGVKQFGNTQRYLSIFNTLGLISNLLDLDHRDRDARRASISTQLNKVLSIPTVSLPNWKDLAATENADVMLSTGSAHEGAEHTSARELLAFNHFVNQVETWLDICNDLKKSFHPSAVLLGKIWNRLYFSLDNISYHARSGKLNKERCAKSMELFAWALINACLVEEFDYHHRDDVESAANIDRKNPVTSGEPVINKFVDISPRLAPLTYMIATCPLILGLLKRDQKSKRPSSYDFAQELERQLDGVRLPVALSDLVCSDDVWDAIGLITVATRGSTLTETSESKGRTPRTKPTSAAVAPSTENN